MSAIGVAVSPAIRQTLLDLIQTQQAYNTVQNQLTTGLKVSSASDNAEAYFKAASLSSRATDFLNTKSNIDQGVSSLDAALTATSAVNTLLQQLQGVVTSADGGSLSTRIGATEQFKAIGAQLNLLVRDASYQGVNLLSSTAATLNISLNPTNTDSFEIYGYNLIATTVSNPRAIFTIAAIPFDSGGAILFSNVVASAVNVAGKVEGFSALDVTGTASGEGTVAASVASSIYSETTTRLTNAIDQLAGIAAALGSYVTILQTRSSFAQDYSSTLTSGADALTLADLNSAAADSEALSLRLQLGIQSIALQDAVSSAVLAILQSGSGRGS